MNVFLSADAGYAAPLAVTLQSIEQSLDRRHNLQVTVLSDGIGLELKNRISRGLSFNIDFLELQDHLPNDLPTTSVLTRAAYGRLVGPRLLGEIGRSVYLDADLLVVADLTELFSWDLDGRTVAAAQDVVTPHISNPISGLQGWKELGMAARTPYFNSGVLVIDNSAWIKQNIDRTVLRFVREHPAEIRLADQDALNGVMRGNFARLPLRWNQQAPLRQPKHLGYSFFEAVEVDRAIYDPAVIHYSGPRKPWNSSSDNAADLWHSMLSKTGFTMNDLPKRSLRRRLYQGLMPPAFTALSQRRSQKGTKLI